MILFTFQNIEKHFLLQHQETPRFISNLSCKKRSFFRCKFICCFTRLKSAHIILRPLNLPWKMFGDPFRTSWNCGIKINVLYLTQRGEFFLIFIYTLLLFAHIFEQKTFSKYSKNLFFYINFYFSNFSLLILTNTAIPFWQLTRPLEFKN